MKKPLVFAASLAGIVLAVAACTPAAPQSATPGSAPSTAAPATGWELSPAGSAGRIAAAGLEVLDAEGHVEHFHAHLDVFADGTAITVPANIGIAVDAAEKPVGISALHSHDPSGIIHVEAPKAGDTFTLGQFLTEWGVLSGTSTSPGSPQSDITGWSAAVNGQKRDGSLNSIVLKAHDEIVLFHGPSPDPLPGSYTFPEGY